MNKITVLTATRAEYGLLSPIIKVLKEKPEYDVRVVATGAHMSPEFGLTYREIEKDGIDIDKKIEILLSSDTPASISKSMGLAMISFAEYFSDTRPDALMVLGDRYETIAVCLAAMNERIPIIHLYGGETTEGAIDEAVRHAITKISYLHLTSTDAYRKRVIQMGESPDRVFTVGAMGVYNAIHQDLMSVDELSDSICFDLHGDYAVVTFHPVTLENASAEKQCHELMKAFDFFPDMKFLITKANADADGRIINKILEEYGKSHDNVIVVDSLGMKRYLSALNGAAMEVGNSSSGLLEVPSFHIPTVNIGDRQKGRLKADSVIDCQPECGSIVDAMKKALDSDFRTKCRTVVNPYGNGDTVSKIISAVDCMFSTGINIKKKFYDISF
ncbi:MAG: UDP-N-acetylglucosamine 2-epimerase [Lachnospiraceae bacterium]|jgi:GDP/UDP-N,N'-diacetylbacillosamine 2-epimerase (hydrolysing)|nr:UDP-N-acetylglucosamine 2-epimerase [Lachnospiraceae bacterium]MEE3460933.1 UDP-N-acetylglucosamine 2-epimerase [Lachnospiraceae bacterium]